MSASATPSRFLARQYTPDTFVYNIDIAGTCNLGCVSCPVGNTRPTASSHGVRRRGFMPFEQFSRTLDKIRREAPVPRPVIALYNWGEPLLHPDIGRIVRLVRANGLFCAVSSNLNEDRFLEDLVQAGPSQIKISLSGFTQDVYGRTHTRGSVEAVKRNMRRLRDLMDLHRQDFDVFVGYHDYVGNAGDEVEGVHAFVQQLGFRLRHKIGRLYPLEKTLPLFEPGVQPERQDEALLDLLLVKPAEWSAVARDIERSGSCVMREQEMSLNYDGSVALCCNVFDYEYNIAKDFLATPHNDLQALKEDHPLCGPCMTAGYPASCGLDDDPGIQAIAARRQRKLTEPLIKIGNLSRGTGAVGA